MSWTEIENFDELTSPLDSYVSCPHCKSDDITHTACGQRVVCSCPVEDSDYYCNSCHACFVEVDEATSLLDYHTDKKADYAPNDIWDFLSSCNHIHQKVTLSGGTTVTATAVKSISKLTELPDFGLYADRSWVLVPAWRNEFINWQDMHIPTHNKLAVEQIKDALSRAQAGEIVDVGCIGAHGRTGTILAIMNLIDSGGKIGAVDSVEYIRKVYCNKAIETSHQEWFVEWAESYLFDLPEPKPWKGMDILPPCLLTSHVAMKLRGHIRCQHDPKCDSFKVDIDRWEKGETVWADTIARGKMELYTLQYGGEKLPTDASHQCLPEEHYAMYLLGEKKCLWHQDSCGYWDQDMLELEENKTINEEKIDELDVEDLLDIYSKG